MAGSRKRGDSTLRSRWLLRGGKLALCVDARSRDGFNVDGAAADGDGATHRCQPKQMPGPERDRRPARVDVVMAWLRCAGCTEPWFGMHVVHDSLFSQAARPFTAWLLGNGMNSGRRGASPEGACRVEYRCAAICHPKVLPGPLGCR